ncbi:tetratricopeptide repeat protein [Chitinophagaceae bacterium LB-8]|uniref:Tetratricopeptide repeat protein n=1 Tax=Paraflavisolibacter caeni TaxID=2982496 RepID=A0A9X3B674_9BACT|nr:adenylate/guanylate cyclase domain-containing protein [Paraflavisolibacter caeni]MCU7547610.1 tetratricopeptide repeat protein [Paraflavisolibacter caeni]
MRSKIIVACVCCFTLIIKGSGQSPSDVQADTSALNTLLAKSKELAGSNPDQAISYSLQAKKLADQIKFPKGTALALKNLGFVYFYQSKPFEAIQYWTQSLEVFKSIKDLSGVSNMLNNIGVIYNAQGDYEKALANYLASLKAGEQSGDQLRIVTALQNVGNVYALKKETYDKALDYYLRALDLGKTVKEYNDIAGTSANIGEVYFNKGKDSLALHYYEEALKAYRDAKDESSLPFVYNAIGKVYKKQGKYDEALRFHTKAYTAAQSVEYNRKQFMAQSLLGLANTYRAKGDLPTALDYFSKAEVIGREINALDELKDIYQGLSSAYASAKQYDEAFKYQTLFTDVKDTLYNIETDKKLTRMEFDFNLQKKQGEINLLTKDKAIRELEVKRQRQAKQALMLGLVMLGVIAFIIFRNFLAKVKINKILDRQKAQIEHLLLNILPSEVAKELQVSGTATPRHYENVSVLFTDFKSFTSIADKMPPQELVEELNSCFMAFDNIIEKYNLEKIKTIGDAYMCAGGIPTPDSDHPIRIVKAAMEIREFIHGYNSKRLELGLAVWDIRIGIHVGPIVAGVVGRKKYAYDIWGSTVNIASRMESNGEPGQINVSAAACEMVKHKFICTPRGKIYAKNIGEIDMYFVESERETPEGGSVTVIMREDAKNITQ